MKADIRVKGIFFNLTHNKKFIEIEVPGDEILQQVEADALEFENLVKQKVIEYNESPRSKLRGIPL
jgi:hypothetical protein